jgi:hypothetical protein
VDDIPDVKIRLKISFKSSNRSRLLKIGSGCRRTKKIASHTITQSSPSIAARFRFENVEASQQAQQTCKRVWWRGRKVEYPKGCRSSASLGEWQLAGKYDRNHDPEFDVIPQVHTNGREIVQYLTTSLTE